MGSAILLEVFIGMLANCATSFISADPEWNPDPCVSKERRHFWSDRYQQAFSRKALVHEDDYYPFELADVARFVKGI